MPTTTNRWARVHPAQPSYSVVVPAPELSSIDVAVGRQMGMIGRFRKGTLPGLGRPAAYCGTSRTTGPLTGGGAAGCAGCSALIWLAGLLVCPIGT
jgi:hypothetical protein